MVLGILPDATQDEIKQAYIKLAKLYHPDKNRSPDATAKMAEINLAYETLRDSQRRKDYDHEIKNELARPADDLQDLAEQYEEDEEIGHQEPSHQWPLGKCVKCNFINNSGMFVCSICGYVFDPHAKSKDKGSNDGGFDAIDDSEDALSEIIRCPRCNEINRYSSGSCWQCGLQFEIEEIL